MDTKRIKSVSGEGEEVPVVEIGIAKDNMVCAICDNVLHPEHKNFVVISHPQRKGVIVFSCMVNSCITKGTALLRKLL